LLWFARAVLADLRILIFDEATSSIDTRTGQRIQAALGRLLRGRTSIVFAHRLSTIREADLILVIESGQWRPTGGFRDSAAAAEMSARAQERLRELRADPAWSAALREKLRRAKSGGPVNVTCKLCGRAIQTSPKNLRRGVGQLCTDTCRAESRRRANLLRWRQDPAYVRVLGLLKLLPPEAFARLDVRPSLLVYRYYGLGGKAPALLNELSNDYGLSAARVGEIIRLAVASLLGPGVVPRSTDTCVICGTAVVRRGPRPRATCGKVCRAERRRRLALERHAQGGWTRRQVAGA
jgi:hypothetical protein